MVSKGKAILALLLLAAQGTGTIKAQANGQVAPAAQSAPKTSSTSAAHSQAAAGTNNLPSSSIASPNANSVATPNCAEGPCDAQPAHITIATPAPAPAPWLWPDRVAWVAKILLAVLGYVGIMVALSTLKKIDRQSHYAEVTAQAAADSAQAALLHAQAIIRAERPWILITVEPSRSVDNSFTVTATNRGRGPARIVSTIDRITTAVDQTHLPEQPEFDEVTPSAALSSVVLLPGESTAIKSFSRDEVKNFCESDEELKRVEKWEELILLYGIVVYRDLMAPGDGETHQTRWCCWYIHGRQKSGMVMAGPPAYNMHT
ncbi:MAG: hypothetical protein ACLQHF_14545 [Terracidiphilus sp.]